MPEITIREIDNTVGYIDEQDYVVFVPGNVNDSSNGNKQYKYIGERTLFTNLDDFINEIGKDTPEYNDENPFSVVVEGTPHYYDPGYLYARFLLSKGYSIYYGVPKGDSQVIDISYNPTAPTQVNVGYDFADRGQDHDAQRNKNAFEQGIIDGQVESDGEGIYVTKLTITGRTYDTTTAVFTSTTEPEKTLSYMDAGAKYVLAYWTSGTFEYDEVTYDGLSASRITYTRVNGTTYKTTTYNDTQNVINNEEFWTDLDDKSLYQFRYLITGGYVVSDETTQGQENDITAMSQIITIANTRGDCIGLLDHTRNLNTKEQIISAARRVTSKRCAMFSPWCSYTINNLSIPMPASMAYLEAFINGVQNNPTWYAMAGRLRGTITGTPIKQYGEKFANSLMSDKGVSVNPITNVYPYGILIWGNRTLNNNSGLVASSFLNIRQLCVDIFKSLYTNAKGYMFEQNSDRLWFNFKSNITKLLDNMKTSEGISGYRIIKLEPERAKVKALIRIVPLEAVEKFDLTVELNDSLISTNE